METEGGRVLTLMLMYQVGRTPWSAADAPVGLFKCVGRAGPGGPTRTRASAPHTAH